MESPILSLSAVSRCWRSRACASSTCAAAARLFTPFRRCSVGYATLGLPKWKFPGRDQCLVVDITDGLMYVASAVFLGFVLYRWIRFRQRPPLLLLAPGLAQYVWFIQSPLWRSFYEFVPFFHS